MYFDKLQAIKRLALRQPFFQFAFFTVERSMLLFETDLDEGITPLR